MCQVKPLGSSWVIVVWSCWKNRNFRVQSYNFHYSQKRRKTLNFFIVDWYTNFLCFPNFQNFWSYRSMRTIRIFTGCSVFDRFCFHCVMCLFWWFYGFLWRVFVIEKLECGRYNAKINMNGFATVLIVVICFLIQTDLTKVLLSFVWLKLSSFGWLYNGWRKKD